MADKAKSKKTVKKKENKVEQKEGGPPMPLFYEKPIPLKEEFRP